MGRTPSPSSSNCSSVGSVVCLVFFDHICTMTRNAAPSGQPCGRAGGCKSSHQEPQKPWPKSPRTSSSCFCSSCSAGASPPCPSIRPTWWPDRSRYPDRELRHRWTHSLALRRSARSRVPLHGRRVELVRCVRGWSPLPVGRPQPAEPGAFLAGAERGGLGRRADDRAMDDRRALRARRNPVR